MQQVIHVSPETRSERDLRLNAAIDIAMSFATKDRAGGILVTRHAPAHFTVAITPEVPYGQVREADDMAAAGQRQLLCLEQEYDGNTEDNSSGSEGGRWDGLWEPAARHYRDIGHPSPVTTGRAVASSRR